MTIPADAGLGESCRVRLRTQLDALGPLFGRADAEAIARRPASGKWSALENLAHVGRHHEVTLQRIRRILAEERPQLPRYRAEDDPGWAAWAGLGWPEVRARLLALRAELVRLVEGLSPDEIQRTGVHPVLGEMAVPGWLEFFLVHEAHHLYLANNLAHART